MALYERFLKWRYRLIPDHLLGELLAKRWIENAIPVLSLLIAIAVFHSQIPNFLSVSMATDTSRLLGEFAFVVCAMMIVMVAGGIDLSVGSNVALGNIVALYLMNVLAWPIAAMVPVVLIVCGLVGLVNGLLVGYLKLRAFLTTLVTLIIVRAIVDMLLMRHAADISAVFLDYPAWDFVGQGSVLGIPFSFLLFAVCAVAGHIFLSRTRPGWHVMAIGGSRRSAYNLGIAVPRTICATYVMSGVLCGVSAILYAARLGNAGPSTGVGMEVMALTAAVLGGNSLGGGKGSVPKAVIGAVIVLLVTDSLVRIGLLSGASSLALGLILLVAVGVDVRWLKNRHKLLAKMYVSPTYLALPPAPSTYPGSDSPYAMNNALKDVELIGLGELEGPEDMIFDRDDNLYTGSRHGDILRILAPDYTKIEVFAHIGGTPLGFAMDRDDSLVLCDAGMGLYRIATDGKFAKLTDETNRSAWSINDDSRLRLADDCDIAPDGRVFFSEATVRYEMHEWPLDALESRGNGRLICYDPRNNSTRTVLRNLVFPNGVCMAHDGQSFFFAESWACRINRYWFDGPKAGRLERVIENLPGYPDNINRASDGTYWLAIMGMRTPSLELALRRPGFRRRMARRVAQDELLFPNLNTGCVIKFDEAGRVLQSLWDSGGDNHPMITSPREHKGYLYLGGVFNNRIGRYKIPGADTSWTSQQSYWGKRT